MFGLKIFLYVAFIVVMDTIAMIAGCSLITHSLLGDASKGVGVGLGINIIRVLFWGYNRFLLRK